MEKDEKIDPRLAALLDELKLASVRDPKAASRARSRFLTQAVSASEEQRHSIWTIFQQKEKFAMNIIMSSLVVLGLLFGGSATVSAAQDDLPTQPLYQIKLVSEDAKIWFESDPTLKIEMLMEQAQTRTEEMAALTLAGITPPSELANRAQERIQQALQLTATLDDAAMLATLDRIRMHLQAQDQLMTQLQDGSCTECEPILQQTREMLHTQLGQVEDSLADPNKFRSQNQARTTQTPFATGSAVTPQTSCTPVLDGTGQQNGNGNPSAGTPMPQDNGNGSGDGNINENNNDGGGGGDGNGNGTGDGNGSAPDPGGQGGRP